MFKKITMALAILIGVCLLPSKVEAHYDTTTQKAYCGGYTIKADYVGGPFKRKVVWDVHFTLNGVTEIISGQWVGISNGFNIFKRIGGPASVKATGTVKMYEQKETCEWNWKWNPHTHKNEKVKECSTNWEQIDSDSFNVDFDLNSCAAPTPTPTASPVPSGTPEPTAEPTPEPVDTQTSTGVSSPGKESAMALTEPTCDNNNMDASITLKNDGQPIAGVNVKFWYENEAKYAKTEANGRAGVAFGFKSESEVRIEPEVGYPSQLEKAHAVKDCPVKAAPMPQVLGLADTGIVDDVVANLAGIFGTLSTVVGTLLYAKTKKSTKAKNKNK